MWRIDLITYYSGRFISNTIKSITEGVGYGSTPAEALKSVPKSTITKIEVEPNSYVLVIVKGCKVWLNP